METSIVTTPCLMYEALREIMVEEGGEGLLRQLIITPRALETHHKRQKLFDLIPKILNHVKRLALPLCLAVPSRNELIKNDLKKTKTLLHY